MASDEKAMVVIGAGAGIGGHAAARFAAGGYHAVLCRRSDEASLQRLVGQIRDEGGSASGYLLNAAEDGAIEDVLAEVERDIGPVEVVLYNLGAQIGDRSLFDTTHKTFELGWRLATFGLFRVAKALAPGMVDRGSGTILVTSATAAMRGNAGQHSHAAAMGGRRLLCQTLNAELAPKGVHVAHVVVDGAVNSPDTLGKMVGVKWQEFLDAKGEDGIIDPADLAEVYWTLAHQPKNCWTHEMDVRPHSDRPWFNGAGLTL